MSSPTSNIVERITAGWPEGSAEVLLGIACSEIKELRDRLAEQNRLLKVAQQSICYANARQRLDPRSSESVMDHLTRLAEDEANHRGWDCFAQKEGGGA